MNALYLFGAFVAMATAAAAILSVLAAASATKSSNLQSLSE
jgi:hypothetical protein